MSEQLHGKVERPDFLVAYDAVKVPTSMLSEDMADDQVLEAVSNFFQDIQEALSLGESTLDNFFEHDTYVLIAASESTVPESKDDRQYFEVFKQINGGIIASVVRTDNGSGYITTQFTKHTLEDLTVQEIRDWIQLEATQHDVL